MPLIGQIRLSGNMARRTWVRCKCGAKLHAKKQNDRICFVCNKKQRKLGKNLNDTRKRY